jgi:hypothetical protein
MKWFDGPRKKVAATSPPKQCQKVLVALDQRLFAKRDVKKKPLKELSEPMLLQASQLYDRVLIIASVLHFSKEHVRALTEDKPNIDLFYMEDQGFLSAVETTKQKLMSYGFEFKAVKNPREINYLNFHRFVIQREGQELIVAKMNDWEIAGIDLDKPLSFEDLAQRRKAKSFW